MARIAAMTAFDRARPLWEFTLVEQLEGGRAALVMKLHHSLTDGLGGMQLMLTLFDVEAHGRAAYPRSTVPSVSELGHRRPDPRRASSGSCVRTFGIMTAGTRSAVPAALRAVPRPLEQSAEATRTVWSDRPDGRAGARHAVTDHEGAEPGPPPRDVRGRRLADLKRAAAVARRNGQRRLHGRGRRWLPPVPRASRSRRRASCGSRCRSASGRRTTRSGATGSR